MLGATSLRLWVLGLLFVFLDVVDVAKELCEVELLLLDRAGLQLANIILDTAKLKLVMSLKVSHEIILSISRFFISFRPTPNRCMHFREVDCSSTLS